MSDEDEIDYKALMDTIQEVTGVKVPLSTEEEVIALLDSMAQAGVASMAALAPRRRVRIQLMMEAEDGTPCCLSCANYDPTLPENQHLSGENFEFTEENDWRPSDAPMGTKHWRH